MLSCWKWHLFLSFSLSFIPHTKLYIKGLEFWLTFSNKGNVIFIFILKISNLWFFSFFNLFCIPITVLPSNPSSVPPIAFPRRQCPIPFSQWVRAWGVNKIWHIKLQHDQAPPRCVKIEHGIPPQEMGSNKLAHVPQIALVSTSHRYFISINLPFHEHEMLC